MKPIDGEKLIENLRRYKHDVISVDGLEGLISLMPSVQPEQCEDAVSRKDAIRWVKTECNPYGKPALDFESGKKVIEHLECMSAVTPERAKGKWISEAKGKEAILDEFGNVTCSAHCSECGDWLTASDEYSCRGRYCPNCGADMRGEKDEQR